MALVDRIATQAARARAAIASGVEVYKATVAQFPPGTARDVSAEVATMAQQTPGSAVLADRLPWPYPQVPFGPGLPPPPGTLDPLFARTNRPLPRRYEYPISWNIPGQGRPYAPWSLLRQMSRQSLIRRCIELRKARITSLDWRITVRPEVVQAHAAANGVRRAQAKQELANRMQPDIDRLTAFWEKPDRIARWTFAEWLSVLLEEHFALDAVSIYPHPQLSGDLHSLELLDGATIKPLLDYRGATPQPPSPAFEQILYGFPRGEFMHSDEGEDFTSDELVYRPKIRRVDTPYGFSPTEMALLDADLYMKRIEWLRAEYNVGVSGEMYMKWNASTQGSINWTPEQVKQYEAIINEEMSGQTAERHRSRMLPPGVDVTFPQNFADRYRAEFDEHVLRLTIMHFGVMPTELGITPRTGLGGSGHQQGEAKSAERNADGPYLEWLTDVLDDISRTYLEMPPELGFAFDLGDEEDDLQTANAWKARIESGIGTINGALADLGEPTFGDIPECDEPFIVAGNQVIFLRGAMTSETEPDAQQPAGPGPSQSQLGPAGLSEQAASEVKSFWTYAANRKRNGSWADFTFEHLEPGQAGYLNMLGKSSVAGGVIEIPAPVEKAEHEIVLPPGTVSWGGKRRLVFHRDDDKLLTAIEEV